MSRKPMTFDIDRSPPTPAELAAKPTATAPTTTPPRKQVGARISTMTYRQLKARAALDGVPVQDLVEKAVEQFLAAG
jgi:predicted DNA binding CopG/RHH family protein